MGTNIKDVLEQVAEFFPSPKGDENKPLRALIFDSYYDNFNGAVCLVRIVDGEVKKGDRIKFFTTNKDYEVTEVGVFKPKAIEKDVLLAGDVGYICASIKNVSETKVGDTITLKDNPCDEPLSGYKDVKPVVYSGIFCVEGDRYNDLKDALEKLKLNDASLEYVPEVSQALGFGFRCGFLGLLHMEIIQERLEREFDLDLITTAPTVNYRITKTDGTILEVSNPADMPDIQSIALMEEPMVKVSMFTPPEYVGDLIQLAQQKRGYNSDLQYLDANRCQLTYTMPLNEIIFDFFDQLKSRSRGYASLDYEIIGYEPSSLVKLDILLNGDVCDALSLIVHKDKAYERGRAIAEKLKTVIPRQLFEVPIQAAIGNKVIARETIKAVRKDVLAKCYGGDITRKRKLLEKQKRGKKRMRKIGSVEIPSEAFISILKID
jgi:GTP-binding protein LepA